MRLFRLVGLIVVINAFQANGQYHIIKSNLLEPVFGTVNAKYEYAFNDIYTVVGGISYSYRYLGVSVNAFGIDAEYRYYLTNRSKPAPEGFYIGPGAGYTLISPRKTEGKASTIGVGATIGYQWVFRNDWSLDLGAAPQYSIVINDVDEEAFDEDFSGILPRLVVSVGYSF